MLFLYFYSFPFIDKNTNRIEKRGFVHLVEYLSRNGNVLNIKNIFPNSDFLNKLSTNLWGRYLNYKEKIIEQIDYPDFNYVNEQLVKNI